MNRCKNLFLNLLATLFAVAALTVTVGTGPASAQTVRREAPADVKFARMAVTLPPQLTLNGQPDRLSPGARIRNTQNLVVLSSSLAGKEAPVVYRRDAAGLVHEVWLLTEEEAARLGGANGAKAFAELLALIFGARR